MNIDNDMRKMGTYVKTLKRGGFKKYVKHKLHCDDGPAVRIVKRLELTESWFKNGKLHRDNGPAIITINRNCKTDAETWWRDSDLFCGDSLHQDICRNNEIVTYYCFYDNGLISRKGNKPAQYEILLSANKRTYRFYEDGDLHREDGPVYETFYGNILHERSWCKHGFLHREDGPANETFYDNGEKHEELWFKNGKIHKDEGPAHLNYDDGGNIRFKEWVVNGERHREDGPAVISSNGSSLEKECWCYRGKIHREDGPAIIRYNCKNEIVEQHWYRYGKRHRQDGAAYIKFLNGKIVDTVWYINDEDLDIFEWLESNNLNEDMSTWSDDMKLLFKITWI